MLPVIHKIDLLARAFFFIIEGNPYIPKPIEAMPKHPHAPTQIPLHLLVSDKTITNDIWNEKK
ncbi:MAG: hypothetical protein IKZ67_08140, partial [Paludibacteraceae bacterium]|nr:hypothetical protein [Paludibacteraceae bacterium]